MGDFTENKIPVENNKNKIIAITIVAIVVLLVIAGVVFLLLRSRRVVPTSTIQLNEEEVSAGLGAQLLEKANNPIKDKLPETNPFQTDVANPLQDVYQNPF